MNLHDVGCNHVRNYTVTGQRDPIRLTTNPQGGSHGAGHGAWG